MTCPICQKTSDKSYRPFCSKRCADVDLGRWFNGSYTVPAENPFPGEAEEASPDHAEDTRH